MKQTINCCSLFSKMRHHFDWFEHLNDKGEKVYSMPVLKSCDGRTNLRINYCPNCGREITYIRLID